MILTRLQMYGIAAAALIIAAGAVYYQGKAAEKLTQERANHAASERKARVPAADSASVIKRLRSGTF